MDVIKENTIKFIDALIVDDYKVAHKFLENVVNEKIKQMIREAHKKEHPFKKADLNKDGKLSSYEKKRGAAIAKSIKSQKKKKKIKQS